MKKSTFAIPVILAGLTLFSCGKGGTTVTTLRESEAAVSRYLQCVAGGDREGSSKLLMTLDVSNVPRQFDYSKPLDRKKTDAAFEAFAVYTANSAKISEIEFTNFGGIELATVKLEFPGDTNAPVFDFTVAKYGGKFGIFQIVSE